MKLFIKSVFSIVAVCALLLVAGCGGSDPKPVSPIVGKWNVDSAEPLITVAGGGTLVSYLVGLGFTEAEAQLFAAEIMDAGAIEVSGTIEFKADGTYETSDGADKATGKWELSADEKTLTVDKGTTHEDITKVITLNDTDLVLEFDLSEDVDLTGIKYLVHLKLKRS